jgi:class 3 adenylate cyclase
MALHEAAAGPDRPFRALTWIYKKLGHHYPGAVLTAELLTAPFIITAATLGLFTFYYDASVGDFFTVLGIALGVCAIAVITVLARTYPRLRPIKRWIAGERDPESTAKAWSTAVGLPLDLIKRDLPIPVLVCVIPGVLAAVYFLDLRWYDFFPLLAGSMVSMGYSLILHYLAVEGGMRPVLIDINREVGPRYSAEVSAIPLRVRLMATLPLINIITGLIVAALTSGGSDDARLGVDVLIAVAVATTVSLELTVLLSKSILRPIADLQRATDAVRKGDFEGAVPVTTGDELGELAASFNQMVEGLRERERIREAFGTYLDKEVAEYILSEGFDQEGVELEVSVVFCDVKDFTRFARNAEATEVVACLNELFEIVVPIVSKHGGHVDKFVGDGLLAVFGAPENYPDHADRAVRAAIEMAREANRPDRTDDLQIGVGVNTGSVVAGSIGGAGRLNFSVIGDPVNVAARVEAATRETGDEVLITVETKRRLKDEGEFELEPRGSHELKGIDEPVELYAAVVPERERAKAEAAAAAGDGAAAKAEAAAEPA